LRFLIEKGIQAAVAKGGGKIFKALSKTASVPATGWGGKAIEQGGKQFTKKVTDGLFGTQYSDIWEQKKTPVIDEGSEQVDFTLKYDIGDTGFPRYKPNDVSLAYLFDVETDELGYYFDPYINMEVQTHGNHQQNLGSKVIEIFPRDTFSTSVELNPEVANFGTTQSGETTATLAAYPVHNYETLADGAYSLRFDLRETGDSEFSSAAYIGIDHDRDLSQWEQWDTASDSMITQVDGLDAGTEYECRMALLQSFGDLDNPDPYNPPTVYERAVSDIQTFETDTSSWWL